MGTDQSRPAVIGNDQRQRSSGSKSPIVNASRHVKQSLLFQYVTAQDWEKSLNRLRGYPLEASATNAFRLDLYGVQRKRVTTLHLVCALRPPLEVVQFILDVDGSESARTFTKNISQRHRSILKNNVASFFSPVSVKQKPAATSSVRDASVSKLSRGITQGSEATTCRMDQSACNDSENGDMEHVDLVMPLRFPSLLGDINSFRSSGLASSHHVLDDGSSCRSPSIASSKSPSIASSNDGKDSIDPKEALQLKPTGSVIHLSPKDSPNYVHSSNSILNESNRGVPLKEIRMMSEKSFRGDANAVADPEADHWLPLHVACLFRASPAVIEALLRTHSWAAKVKNGMGMLPIHIVCSNIKEPPSLRTSMPSSNVDIFLQTSGAWDILKTVHLLLRAFPESVHVPSSNADGMTPLTYAEENFNDGKTKSSLLELLRTDSSMLKSLADNAAEAYDGKKYPAEQSGLIVHSFRTNTPVNSRAGGFFRMKRTTKLKSDKPTRLLQHISARDWKSALDRIARAPIEASVWTMIDAANADIGEPDNDVEHDFCHRLPLHRACALKAPRSVVEALHKVYPSGMSSKEKYGMLPLHLACQYGASHDVVEFIVTAYPNGVQIKDAFGLLPIHIACTEGAPVKVILCLLDEFPASAKTKDDKGWTPLDYAKLSFHPHRRTIVAALEARKVAYA